MSWARYDDMFPVNRKVARAKAAPGNAPAGLAALGLHLLLNTWSRHEGTGGFIPAYMPDQLAGGRPGTGTRLAGVLVDAEMLDSATEPEPGWILHNFDRYSDPHDDGRSAEEKRRELSEMRREAGRLGGLAKARNSRQTPGNGSSKPVALLEQTSAPVPEPVPGVVVPETSSPPPPPGGGGGASPSEEQIRDALASIDVGELASQARCLRREQGWPTRNWTDTAVRRAVTAALADGRPTDEIPVALLACAVTADPAPTKVPARLIYPGSWWELAEVHEIAEWRRQQAEERAAAKAAAAAARLAAIETCERCDADGIRHNGTEFVDCTHDAEETA